MYTARITCKYRIHRDSNPSFCYIYFAPSFQTLITARRCDYLTMAADMGSTVLGIIIFLLALGGIFIVLRVYTRIFIKKGAIWWDDALIVITWVSLTSLRHETD